MSQQDLNEVMPKKIKDEKHLTGVINGALIANSLQQAEVLALEQLRFFCTPSRQDDGYRSIKRNFALNYVNANGESIIKGLNTYSFSGTIYIDIINYE